MIDGASVSLKFFLGGRGYHIFQKYDNTSQKIQKVVKKIVHTTFCGMTGLGFTSFHFLKKRWL